MMKYGLSYLRQISLMAILVTLIACTNTPDESFPTSNHQPAADISSQLSDFTFKATASNIDVDENVTLSVQGKTKDNETVTLAAGVQWFSSDIEVASISQDGKVVGLKDGAVILLAVINNEVVSKTLTVGNGQMPASTSTLELDSATIEIKSTQYIALNAVIKNTDGTEEYVTDQVIWFVSDASIIDVDSFGVLTAKAQGESLVIAVSNGLMQSSLVTVSDLDDPTTTGNSLPVISLLGEQTVQLFVGNSYEDAGVTAVDAEDGDITAFVFSSGEVNVEQAGEYEIEYSVSDSNGAAALTLTRVVVVIENTPPVLTLIGDAVIDIFQGGTYTDAGATANDEQSGDISADIVVQSQLDTAVLGVYEIKYDVSDAQGLAATSVLRTVNVLVDNRLSQLSLSDNALQQCVDNAIEENAALNTIDDVIQLKCTGLEIVDLSGLEIFPNLTELYLDQISTLDVSTLPGIMSLQTLDVSQTGVTNLQQIAKLTSLRKLVLEANEIVDVSPLNSLTELTNLSLYNNSVSDISSLSALVNLQYLDLSENLITDIGVLSNMAQLINLNLSSNRLVDILVIENLVELAYLNLQNNGDITNINSLQSLAKLNYLYLQNIGVTDVGVLQNLTTLTNLSVSSATLTDITSLSSLGGLLALNLKGSHLLQDISPVANLTQLKVLNFSISSVSDISSLASLINLTSLEMTDNDLVDITSLANMTNLENLQLDNNSIEDISALSGLDKLVLLSLANNKIIDVSAVSNLLKLSQLNLSRNQIATSVTELANLLDLDVQTINLLGNDDIPCGDLTTLKNAFDAKNNTGLELVQPLMCI